jgi:ABC-type dipeptide/oligopeptide/nickel transport system permease component
VTKRLCILIVTVCCLVTSTFRAISATVTKDESGYLARNKCRSDKMIPSPEELDRIEKDKDQLNRLIAEQKLRVISSLRVRTRLGESFSARTGQQVPIQTATLPVYRPIDRSKIRSTRFFKVTGTPGGLA